MAGNGGRGIDPPDFDPGWDQPQSSTSPAATVYDGMSDPLPGQEWARGLTYSDLDSIPPREWLYGTKFIRGFTTVIGSPGGVGKTAYSFAAGLACASGQRLLGDKPHRALRVWLYNMEDPYAELQRRLKAAMLHYALPPETLQNWFMNSGKDRRGNGRDGCLKIAWQDYERIVIGPDVDLLVSEIRRLGVDLFWADPFVMTHEVKESDNSAQERVLREFNRVATETGCAIVLNHHTRKGFVPGDPDSIRGGGSLVAASRASFTMAPMPKEDAEALGVSAEERRFLVRIDDAKVNLAPKSDKAEWLKLVSRNIGNGTPDYPSGDNVQVATAWTPPDVVALSTADLNAVLDLIERGPVGAPGMLYQRAKQSRFWVGACFQEVAAARGFSVSDRIIKDFVDAWIANEVLMLVSFTSQERRSAQGLRVNNVNRPGTPQG